MLFPEYSAYEELLKALVLFPSFVQTCSVLLDRCSTNCLNASSLYNY